MICAGYHDDPETRARLMEPVRIHNERIGRYIGRHADPPGVDPDSGEPTDDQGEPTDGQPDGGQSTDSEGDTNETPDEEG